MLCSVLIFISCEESDNFSDLQNGKNLKDATIINGRFYFASKQSLKSSIEDFKKVGLTGIEDKFARFYQDGFRSNTPIVNPNNDELIKKLDEEYASVLLRKKSKIYRQIIDNESNFIGDPYFAAVVNNNNEIVVGDSLYKIIPNMGVLSVKLQDSLQLFNYLDAINLNNPVKDNTANPLEMVNNQSDICEMQNQYPGNTQLNDYISRYIAPPPVDCSSYVAPTTDPFFFNPINYLPQLSNEEQLQNVISNLPICNADDTSRFQSIFGANKSCVNYFDSKHRIKTEYWNQQWGIYASNGVQVRTQVKRVWVWWASNVDEIHMGVNRVYLKFNYPDPEINSQVFESSFYNKPEVPVYMYKGEFKILRDGFGGYVYPNFIKANTSLPFFEFKRGVDILNIYLKENVPFFGKKINLKSESVVKELYKLGINFLKSELGNQAGSEFVITYQKSATEVEVLYFGEKYKDENDNDLSRVFYRDTEFVISSTFNPNGGTTNSSTGNPNGKFNFSFSKPEYSHFRDYTDYDIDFYGVARRGSTWSGNRLNAKN
jgi:hypothetical protein